MCLNIVYGGNITTFFPSLQEKKSSGPFSPSHPWWSQDSFVWLVDPERLSERAGEIVTNVSINYDVSTKITTGWTTYKNEIFKNKKIAYRYHPTEPLTILELQDPSQACRLTDYKTYAIVKRSVGYCRTAYSWQWFLVCWYCCKMQEMSACKARAVLAREFPLCQKCFCNVLPISENRQRDSFFCSASFGLI